MLQPIGVKGMVQAVNDVIGRICNLIVNTGKNYFDPHEEYKSRRWIMITATNFITANLLY